MTWLADLLKRDLRAKVLPPEELFLKNGGRDIIPRQSQARTLAAPAEAE